MTSAAAAALLFAASPASAADGGVYTTNGSGYASWVEAGDTMLVCDLASDGYGVRGYVYTPYASNPASCLSPSRSDP